MSTLLQSRDALHRGLLVLIGEDYGDHGPGYTRLMRLLASSCILLYLTFQFCLKGHEALLALTPTSISRAQALRPNPRLSSVNVNTPTPKKCRDPKPQIPQIS